ncbi:MAG: endopeptidase La [Anaerolineae bacterium]|nr:endopeptidase La [Anaerolineae bacterium]MDW8172439.1 endopeptidase La [Anaerolineae bacterium]
MPPLTSTAPSFDLIKNSPTALDGTFEASLLLLEKQVVWPNLITPLQISGDSNRSALRSAAQARTTLIACQLRDDKAPTELLQRLYTIGTEIAVGISAEGRDGVVNVLAQGRRRVEVVSVLQTSPEIRVRVRHLPDLRGDQVANAAALERLIDLFNQYLALNESLPAEMSDYLAQLEDEARVVDSIAATLSLNAYERQRYLEERQVSRRIENVQVRLLTLVSQLRGQSDLNARVQADMSRGQREIYLREQMRVIQTELGESDPFTQELNLLRQRIHTSDMPAEVRTKALEELGRLQIMTPLSPESGIVRTYLDWLLDVPWTKASKDNLNIKHAERVLHKAHYGLEKVKERILEHIAVRKLAGDKMKSPILCFVGPPGVGKTSLGRSIAEALGREFVRVSLGGVRDEAEIRGHRRTYIGALPGRIIQTMKRAGTINPVFMLDEIDKMTADYRGDPSAALLEVLDPEQNTEFMDHYLDVPYDLSKVLFIATANDLDPLPEALEDRLEVIEFHAYTEEEKQKIAQQFLIPKQLTAHGLKRYNIQFQADSVQVIIRQYTQEAGVRNLERQIATICRKLAHLAVTRKHLPRRITPRIVERYLGPPYTFETRVNRQDSVGLVTGLVWSSSGGDTQIIEVSLFPGKGNLTLTGSLGDVLQESAQAALSYMRSRAVEFDVPSDDFENYDVHIHLPEGAVPKDGPSAGIALATGIVSAFTERAVRSDTAMTGEVTLRGYVLPVGGVKEKVLAARRRQIKRVILPADNEKDLVEIPKPALRDLEICLVRTMQEVLDLVLLSAPPERQRDIQRKAEEAEGEDDES